LFSDFDCLGPPSVPGVMVPQRHGDEDLRSRPQSLLEMPAQLFVEELVRADDGQVAVHREAVVSLQHGVGEFVQADLATGGDAGAEHVARHQLGLGHLAEQLQQGCDVHRVEPFGVPAYLENLRIGAQYQ
jgi:hypothetical protein